MTVSTSVELSDLDDSIDDDDEVLELRGSTTNPGITVTPDTLTITDDDTADLKLSPDGGMDFSEIGGRYYGVKLGSEPTSDVTVTIRIPADAKFTISADTLTFTPDDWNQEQLVWVEAVADPDSVTEPAQNITHSLDSSDAVYRALPSVEYPITVRDTVGGSIDVTGSPLTVDEGSTGTYTVVLSVQPTADVTVAITGMTGTDVSVDDDELTFTDQNWDQPQTVTVTAAPDDDIVNDSVTLTHTATGGGYDDVATVDVEVTVVDDGVLPGNGGVRLRDLQRGGERRHDHDWDQGERGHGHGEAVRRPGAHGDHPHHGYRPGRGQQRRLLRGPRRASPSTPATRRRPSPSPPPPTTWTTTGSR